MDNKPDEIDISDLIELEKENKEIFEEILSEIEYDKSGMWFSEIFLFATVIDYLNVDLVIESGRARGISTKAISLFNEKSSNNIEIISIDNRPESKDTEIGEKRLSKCNNVDLKYGNSIKIIPHVLEKKEDRAAILIDGPKRMEAIKLAIDALKFENVKLVAVHDLRAELFERNLTELIFPNSIFTDKDELVRKFKKYDEKIHQFNKEIHEESEMYGPYLQSGEKSLSYGPTLGLFPNSSEKQVREQVLENYRDHLDDSTELISNLLKIKKNSDNLVISNISKLLTRLGNKIK